MNAIALNVRVQLQELARYPGFTVPSIALPLLTYVTFGLPRAGRPDSAAPVLVSFAAFAVLGIVMFQFGVGIASERATPWERFVRTLPHTGTQRFTARIVVAIAFGVASVIPLVCCALLATPLHLGALAWLRVALALLVGAVPLGLLGIMLGYLLSERGALPVTNLLFLPLAYAGGLFGSPPGDLPRVAARISPWLPTRQWSDLVIDFGLGGRLPGHQLVALAAYGVVFGLLAVAGYRRDELRDYR